jgi:hypothetical protein
VRTGPKLATRQAEMRERNLSPRRRRRGLWALPEHTDPAETRRLQVAFLSRRGWSPERIARELRVPVQRLDDQVV